jgi:hypothetical protein
MQSTDYLVVLNVVGRTRGRERERIYRALGRPADEVDAAITSLEQAGVVVVKGKRIYATPALKLLDDLDLIGV